MQFGVGHHMKAPNRSYNVTDALVQSVEERTRVYGQEGQAFSSFGQSDREGNIWGSGHLPSCAERTMRASTTMWPQTPNRFLPPLPK